MRTYVAAWLPSPQGMPDWDGVEPLEIDQYLWMDNGYEPETRVKVCCTDHGLHLLYRVYEERPTIRYTRMQEPVYKDSCVEFFLQPAPDADARYVNFELNAAGTLLLGLGADRNGRERITPDDPDLFRIRAAVGLTDPVDARTYWQVEFSVPFSWLRSLFPAFVAKPEARMRANFYKCGDDTPLPHYGCWNRVTSDVPDFHRSGDFGELILGTAP
jgi:hypothetical protein